MKNYMCALGLLGAILFLAAVTPAHAQIVYSNNFEGSVGVEWASATTDVTPIGARHFLGQFGNNTVSLTLSGLPVHTSLNASLSLFLIHSWDGNSTGVGPDVWRMDVSGGQTLLNTTFGNGPDVPGFDRQAYPGTFPGGDNLAQTGAAEVNTLGYTFGVQGLRDSVYNLSFSFPHTASSVTLNFSANGLEGLDNESWGIDNVTVAVPEPTAAALTALMIAQLAARRHSGKRKQLQAD